MSNTEKVNEYYEFVRWIALPESLRKEEMGLITQQEFAIAKNVHPATLSGWKQDDSFWLDVERQMRSWAKARSPQVLSRLFENIDKKGSAPEVRLWWEIVEGMKGENPKEKEGLNITFILNSFKIEKHE